MSNLLYLGQQEFYVDRGTKGPVVFCALKGVVFVMFHANPQVCQFCDIAKPEFIQLAQIIGGAKFGLCNLSQYPELVQMSANTITPLNKVPLFILFVNGRPFMNYEGPKLIKHFAEFMQQALARLQSQQVFSAAGVATMSLEETEKTPHGLAYDYDYVTVSNPSTMGSVTCNEDGVCYLTSKEALGSLEEKPNQQHPMNSQSHQQSASGQMQQYRQQQPYYPQQQQQQQAYQQQQQQYGGGVPQMYRPAAQPYYPPQQQQQYGGGYTQAQQNYMYQQRPQQAYYPPQQQNEAFYQR